MSGGGCLSNFFSRCAVVTLASGLASGNEFAKHRLVFGQLSDRRNERCHMRAVLCKSLDGPNALVLEDIPKPVPGPDEVLVDVHAAALNFFDTLITRGKYQLKPDLPFSPCGELAGVVAEVGANVRDITVGQRVAAYVSWGGAREFAVVSADRIIPLPDNVDFAVASGASITYGTAIHGLIDRGNLKAGETVAVLGASGGAGLAAVEVAKVYGGKVIAVASTDEKLQVAKQHGADILVKSSPETLKADLRDVTDGKGVDIIYDCVGGDLAEPALRATAWNGRFLVVGFASGDIQRIPANLLLVKGCATIGVFWGESVRRHPEGHKNNMIRLFEEIAADRLSPRIHGKFGLDQIKEALQILEDRKASGKVVIDLKKK